MRHNRKMAVPATLDKTSLRLLEEIKRRSAFDTQQSALHAVLSYYLEAVTKIEEPLFKTTRHKSEYSTENPQTPFSEAEMHTFSDEIASQRSNDAKRSLQSFRF